MAKLEGIELPVGLKVEPLEFEYLTDTAAAYLLDSAGIGRMLNEHAAEGWRFVAFDGGRYIFERIKQRAVPPPE
jgi:hypothetical protein